jgi:predicted CxxxxCH...CXXCH cytochrome family protein
MSRSTVSALVGLTVALAACGEARQLAAGAEVAQCARCHGGEGSSTGAPSEGAHATHVQALSGSLACEHCHPDPRGGSTAHMNGRVEVAFGALATHGDALASRFDRETLGCSAVYCHGAFDGGNESNAPAWMSVGQGQGDCGTCHGLPPAATHAAVPPDLSGCASCHPSTVSAQGVLLAGGEHLNGRVDALDDDCVSCHRGIPGGAAVRSSHLAGAGNASSACRGCHEATPEGHYRVPAGDAACVECHGGHGEALAGRTPPRLVGWNDVSGDFHGARTGAGFGGTLRAPYVRGQASLPCMSCHDAHSSANAFLLAATVNGTSLPAAAIDRAGTGAEALCEACHEGERHAKCIECHGVDREPAGSACFWCHGHEGILHWTAPDPEDHRSGGGAGCDHCHGYSQPQTEYVAPRISEAASASGITATTATVRWRTDEAATSYIEYGVDAPGWTAGDAAFVYQHAVTVTGLQPSTTYVWRVRSSDQFRNVTESALRSFTTPGADDVPRPDVATVWAGADVPSTTAVATLLWYPVTAPSGTAVEYEVQLASDPGFTFLLDADLSRADETLATGNSGWITGTPTHDGSYPSRPAVGFGVTLTNLPQDDCMSPLEPNVYYFRVRARDALGNVSEWSGTGNFAAMAVDVNC